MSSRMAGATLLRHLGPRLFAAAAEPASGSLAASARGIMPAAARIFPTRMASTDAKQVAAEKPEPASAAATATEQQGSSGKQAIVSYWGVQPRTLVREDGTEWPWFCFTPWDTYRADTSIDVKKHHEPRTLPDKVAYYAVRSLRLPMDLFFQRRHASHALLLETVAAVPPMVGGVLLHLRSLRRFEHSGGWQWRSWYRSVGFN